MTEYYSSEDQYIISCPSQDQVRLNFPIPSIASVEVSVRYLLSSCL